MVCTWNSTPVYTERAAATRSDLPLILDDTKHVRDPRIIDRVLYQVSAGQGRGRGSVKGTRATLTFHTILISSGEEPATSFAKAGGAHARTVSLWGGPFGCESAADVVHAINTGLRINFGHAGPALVQYILDHREQWPNWRHEFREKTIAKFVQLSGENNVLVRYAEYMALIETTATMASQALGSPWGPIETNGDGIVGPIEPLWDDIKASAHGANIALDALRHVTSWAHANLASFFGSEHQNSVNETVRPREYFGRWDTVGNAKWEYLAIFPHKLKDVLEKAAYQPDGVVKTWADNGWLQRDQGHNQKKIRIDGKPTWMYVIKRSAMDA